MEMVFEPGRGDQELVVLLEGDLDLYAAVAFAQAVLTRMETGARRIVVDLGAVRYLDSSGVGALIRLLQKARTLGGGLRLSRLAGTPRKVLEMSNMLSVMPTHPDVPSALAAWG
jgi:anti-anti-sigma factor